MIKVPVSVGELFDKITILEIKSQKILDESKLKNVNKELKLLCSVIKKNNLDEENKFKSFMRKLKDVNSKLWLVEDEIRLLDSKGSFKNRFIELARSVYLLNDKRARIKKDINVYYGSCLIEEKSYKS